MAGHTIVPRSPAPRICQRAGFKKLMMDLDAVLEKAQAHQARLAVPAAGCEAERLLASVQAHAQPQASPPPQHVPADHHMLPAFSNRLICRLHPIEVANTKALLEKPYTVGTMCSGTDVPVMALASFQQALADYTLDARVAEVMEHTLSAEISPEKAAVLEEHAQDPTRLS